MTALRNFVLMFAFGIALASQLDAYWTRQRLVQAHVDTDRCLKLNQRALNLFDSLKTEGTLKSDAAPIEARRQWEPEIP